MTAPKNELLRIADMVSHATCADRTIDAAIWQLIPHHSVNGDKSNVFFAPRYTGSLDAAASLIPEGHDWILERVNDGITIGARVGHNDPDRTSWGDTPALALCAAALRAIAETVK